MYIPPVLSNYIENICIWFFEGPLQIIWFESMLVYNLTNPSFDCLCKLSYYLVYF